MQLGGITECHVVTAAAELQGIAVLGTVAPTPPSGWILLLDTTNDSALRQVTYYKVAGASEGSSYVWSFGSAQNASGGIIAYVGVHTVQPIDVAAGQSNAASTSIAMPSVTTDVQGTRLVGLFSTATSATFTPPTRMIERGEITSGKVKVAMEIADVNQFQTGGTGVRSAIASVAAMSIGQTVALRPATAVATSPHAPASLTATAGDSTVNLSWTASAGATGYNLYRGIISGNYVLQSSGITALAFIDNTVTNGTTYYYAVTAINTAGESGYSPEATATPIAAPPTITLSPTTLPSAKIGAAYQQQIGANGGSAPYTYAVTSGTLPSGLTLSAGGLLSGSARSPSKTYAFTITATDANRYTGNRQYSIIVTK